MITTDIPPYETANVKTPHQDFEEGKPAKTQALGSFTGFEAGRARLSKHKTTTWVSVPFGNRRYIGGSKITNRDIGDLEIACVRYGWNEWISRMASRVAGTWRTGIMR